MAKNKIAFNCTECGTITSKWSGKCDDCGAWNSLTEVAAMSAVNSNVRQVGYAGSKNTAVVSLNEVNYSVDIRITTQCAELDRVLGGGLVTGSVILIGGDPGIGKSTILLQTLANLSKDHKTLYITGEESLQQVKVRASRLGFDNVAMRAFTETNIERIIATASKEQPQMMVIDSIQTMFCDVVQSAPGSVAQVRESTAQLVRFAKQSGVILFLVGHVTKEGTLAGPRVLEHMVDTVLYFEGESDSRYRVIRAVKNRFGAVNELGIFAMCDTGLKAINNPSAIFLSRYENDVPGSIVMATWEGSRPILIELQALVDESHLANPRRVVVGLEQNRLALILAVLHRHAGIVTYDQDVFVNVVGGMRITETATDLPTLLAVISSLKNKPLPKNLIVFGEVGLSGEIRPVQSGAERLKAAQKHGFKQAIVPYGNMPKKIPKDFSIIPVKHLREVLDHI